MDDSIDDIIDKQVEAFFKNNDSKSKSQYNMILENHIEKIENDDLQIDDDSIKFQKNKDINTLNISLAPKNNNLNNAHGNLNEKMLKYLSRLGKYVAITTQKKKIKVFSFNKNNLEEIEFNDLSIEIQQQIQNHIQNFNNIDDIIIIVDLHDNFELSKKIFTDANELTCITTDSIIEKKIEDIVIQILENKISDKVNEYLKVIIEKVVSEKVEMLEKNLLSLSF